MKLFILLTWISITPQVFRHDSHTVSFYDRLKQMGDDRNTTSLASLKVITLAVEQK